MDIEKSCASLKTIDNLALAEALRGNPLNIETKLECGNTLARRALEEIGPKTVRITSPVLDGTLRGSGFFTGKDGDLVVTNVHVVADSKFTTVETNTGERFRAKIVDIDDTNDLAVLKIEGIKKDPKRSLNFADDNELKSGDPTLAVGYPANSPVAVVSDGSFIAKLPQVMLLQPTIAGNMIRKTAAFQIANPAFSADAEKYLFSPLVGMDTPLWHGNSGGPVVNEFNRVVGVATAIDPSNPYMTMAQPSSNVKELLERIAKKEQKFEFAYEDQSAYDRNRSKVLGESAAVVVVSGLLRRIAAPVLGGLAGYQSIENLRMAAEPNSFAGRGHYLAAAGEQLLGLAGGVMSLVPRTRTVGYGLAGAGLLLDLSHNFRTDTSLLKEVTRTSGEKRVPFGWGGYGL
jgi:S1-C subfamily serine protease